jgi:hypothetical protein
MLLPPGSEIQEFPNYRERLGTIRDQMEEMAIWERAE